jgi:hypothetical protein
MFREILFFFRDICLQNFAELQFRETRRHFFVAKFRNAKFRIHLHTDIKKKISSNHGKSLCILRKIPFLYHEPVQTSNQKPETGLCMIKEALWGPMLAICIRLPVTLLTQTVPTFNLNP